MKRWISQTAGRASTRRWLSAVVVLICVWSSQAASPKPDPAFLPDLLTPAERRWLETHPGIRVAPTPDYQPVEFFDSQGRYSGMTSEYFRLIERRIGYRFEFIRLTDQQWQNIDPRKRGADVITASAETPTRAPFWNFTAPYLTFPTYLITRSSVDDGVTLAQLAGSRVAVVKGWAAQEHLRTEHPQILVDPVLDAPTGLRKVSFGIVDAFVTELPLATSWMEKEGITNLKLSGVGDYTYRLSISTRKDWPELKTILDKALLTITPAERQAIYQRWVGIRAPKLYNLRLVRMTLWIGAGLVAFLGVIVAWNRLLASQVRARTKELREELHHRIEASEALKASEERFSELFVSSPVPICLTTVQEGMFLDINPAFSAAFGYSREDCLGHTAAELGIYCRPEDRQKLLHALTAHGSVRDWDVPLKHKDGRDREVHFSAQRLHLSEGKCVLSVLQDITDRKRAQMALLASEERFAKSFRSSPVAMCISTLDGGEMMDANAAFLRMHEFKDSSEVIGRTSRELGLWVDATDREDIITQLRQEKRLLNLKRPFRRRSGTTGVGLYSVELIDLGGTHCAILLINDITEREEAEEALRDSEDKFARAFRNSPDAILLTSFPAGTISEMNEGVCRLTGYTREELIGRTTDEVQIWCNPNARKQYLALLQEKGRVVDFEAEFQMKDGQVRLGHISGEMVHLRQGVHLMAIVRDITERKRAELDRQRLLAQLMESEDEERRRIARELHDTTAQHLAALQINLTRLRDTSPAEADPQLIIDSLGLVGRSVQEIRTLSYLLHPPLLDELGLAGALADYARGFAKRSGVRVELNLDGYSGRLPYALELVLFRVVQESLTNVHHHSGSKTATVRLDRDGDEVRLEVQDSGRGIPAETPHGVGLLGMLERLRQVGGDLDIESDGEGTTVLASIPLPQNVADQTPERITP